MMTLVDMTLAAEHAAAVARLDADLVIASSGSPDFDVHQLRSRAVSAYRAALSAGAGKPADSSWNVLALTVNAYVARVEATARTRDARAAVARLDSLGCELLPELLDRRRSIAG